ncbi:hypothetical protein SeLEV6574_g07700 [Synchytrium endobioticum]|uniref:Uncharacterized protein n=1 Tax=Synchytrium endobioticum TaxID=286115 RepID=A0A507CC90_9FUNG|nr:hypothetical protein SeLEV6574_g07700 [Synchytrium endobioticum]
MTRIRPWGLLALFILALGLEVYALPALTNESHGGASPPLPSTTTAGSSFNPSVWTGEVFEVQHSDYLKAFKLWCDDHTTLLQAWRTELETASRQKTTADAMQLDLVHGIEDRLKQIRRVLPFETSFDRLLAELKAADDCLEGWRNLLDVTECCKSIASVSWTASLNNIQDFTSRCDAASQTFRDLGKRLNDADEGQMYWLVEGILRRTDPLVTNLYNSLPRSPSLEACESYVTLLKEIAEIRNLVVEYTSDSNRRAYVRGCRKCWDAKTHVVRIREDPNFYEEMVPMWEAPQQDIDEGVADNHAEQPVLQPTTNDTGKRKVDMVDDAYAQVKRGAGRPHRPARYITAEVRHESTGEPSRAAQLRKAAQATGEQQAQLESKENELAECQKRFASDVTNIAHPPQQVYHGSTDCAPPQYYGDCMNLEIPTDLRMHPPMYLTNTQSLYHDHHFQYDGPCYETPGMNTFHAGDASLASLAEDRDDSSLLPAHPYSHPYGIMHDHGSPFAPMGPSRATMQPHDRGGQLNGNDALGRFWASSSSQPGGSNTNQ